MLFFAATRDTTGCSERQGDLPPEVTNVAAFLSWLRGEFPTLESYLDCLRIARNEEFVSKADGITAGDVLAVIPPVAGG